MVGVWLDDRFLIEERIATGGFGAVYRGRSRDGQPVALKVLHDWLTSDDRIVARFRREGATLTQLHSPHTVRTLALGETRDGLLYIVMELLGGDSLDARMRRAGAMPWQNAVAIARAVCAALAEAHALGVIHRDLKPANLLMDGDVVKVIDFGIAKITRGSAVDDGRELTHAGHMVGTFDYMSPEQLTNADCRAPADIYALGLVLYEMLTGTRAFPQSTGPAAMLATLLTHTPAPPSIHAAIPPALDRVVMRCIERDVDARYAHVGELIAALDAVVAAHHTREEITVVSPVFSPATWVDTASPWPVDSDDKSAARADKADDKTDENKLDDKLSDRTIATAPLDITDDDDSAAIDAVLAAKAARDRAVPSFSTLPGVAVAPKRLPRRAGQLAAQPSLPPTIPPPEPRRRIADPDASLADPGVHVINPSADIAWIPPLPQPEVQVAPPAAPLARGSSSDLHLAATLEGQRPWALVFWLAFVILGVAGIACAALLR